MTIKNAVFVAMLAVLTSVGALIVIPLPFSPVPITMQTFFCLISGAVLGGKNGMYSQLAYLLLGIAGLPVFSRGGSGIGILFGPTGGYLFAFVIAAYICGKFTDRGKVLTGMISGLSIIYLLGSIQLKFISVLSWKKALLVGILPFIPGGIVKIVIAYAVYRTLKRIGVIEKLREEQNGS